MTQRTTDNGITVLTADEGKILKHGNTYSTEVWLGKNDTPDNWEEVDYSEYEDWLIEEEARMKKEMEDADLGGADYADADGAGYDDSSILDEIKAEKIAEIEAYDKSDKVNVFFVNDFPMWLDKDTRVGLDYRLRSEKEEGKTETTLWYGTRSITVSIDMALMYFSKLEVYASACYDTTQKHKANVEAMTRASEVRKYDIKTGYPEPISVTLN